VILYYSPVSGEAIKRFKVPVVSFGAFMDSNKKTKQKNKESGATKRPGPGDTATIIYTSGTTGQPKGVVLTHRDIVASVNAVLKTVQRSNLKLTVGERFVSYLPLNHIAAQVLDIYLPLCTLRTVWFADKDD